MEIIQELYSGKGMAKEKHLKDVSRVVPKTGALDFTKYTSILQVDGYPMVFRTTELRDAAYKKIMSELTPEVRLTLDDFYEVNLTESKILKLLIEKKFDLIKSLNYNINYLLKVHSFNDRNKLKKLDAFRDIPTSQLNLIISGKDDKGNPKLPVFSNEQISMFSKTLIFPKSFEGCMRPSDFWHGLHTLFTTNAASSSTYSGTE